MATPSELLSDAVVSYLSALDQRDFDALVAQARPPAETPAAALGYVANDTDPHLPRTTRRATVADAKAEAARRHTSRQEANR
ncbi:hypothetical protein [Nocardia sp. CY41]|uniref:hypothetical protein n=1 Tax=Nocardia sp. CY41 TaxID=2608686 RepID=UPI00135A5DF1|nr:hypothetical protein [Nocardia sp. CY41]